jgi:U3 small nucleolar RNA-associated protein 25
MLPLDLDEDNNATTRLLTLLNVSALKSSKRRRTDSVEPAPRVKLNKRRSVQFDTSEPVSSTSTEDEGKSETPLADAVTVVEGIEDDRGSCAILVADPTSPDDILEEEKDPYEEHFGAQSSHLSPTSQGAMERNSWRTTRSSWRTLGSLTESVPEDSNLPDLPTNGNPVAVRRFLVHLCSLSSSTITQVLPRLKIQFESSQEKLAQSASVVIRTIVPH